MRRSLVPLLALLFLLPRPARAESADPVAPEAAAAAPGDEAAEEQAPPFEMHPGPTEGKLAVATLRVPEGYGFVPTGAMDDFNGATGNLPNPNDVGALVSPEGWLVFFNWDPVGYVEDDEKDDLDAEAMMKGFQKSQGPANERRRELGFTPLYIEGWEQVPHYDEATHNLTWATRYRAEGAEGYDINHEVRLLGRRGVMSAILVGSPEQMTEAVPALDSLLTGFDFDDGERYAEYRKGDKLAEYGLTGLVLGGGALLAAKGGLFGKLGKFAKFIVVGVIAAGGAVWRRIKGLFGRA